MVIKGAHLLLIRRCEHVVLRAAQAQQHGLDTVLGAARDDAVEVDPKSAVVSTGMQGRSSVAISVPVEVDPEDTCKLGGTCDRLHRICNP